MSPMPPESPPAMQGWWGSAVRAVRARRREWLRWIESQYGK